MTPEAALFLEKANKLLDKAQFMLGAGLYEDAGRSAYLAGFHAAQGFLFDSTGKTFKTHHGVQVEFRRVTKDDARFTPAHRSFMADTYPLKSIADYVTGHEVEVTAAEAANAMAAAYKLLNHIAALLRPDAPMAAPNEGPLP